MKKFWKGLAVSCAFVLIAPLAGACDLFGGSQGSVKELSGETLQSEYISWNGRNYYNETNELNYFFYGNSGFTVDFYGTELEATFYATNFASSAHRPSFVVTVDNELVADNKIKLDKDNEKVVLDETVIKLTESTVDTGTTNLHTVKLASGLEEGAHTLTLYKMGEAKDNTTALKSIKTDNKFYKQTENDKLKIEIIGSSGITGYGDLSYSTADNKGRNTSNSFGAFSLAGLTALMLNADTSFMSVSGGVLCENIGGLSLQTIYDYTGRIEGNDNNGGIFKVNGQNVMYNHEEKMDIVIINMGGNDSQSANLDTLQPQAVNAFTAKLLQTHPNATIVWTGRGNYGSRISSAVNALNNPKVVYVGPIEGAGGSNTAQDPHYGANDHASIRTQLTNANMILDKLATLGIQKQRTITIQEI
ncbi:MAG: hypothetical protein J6K71_01560 [Clostridia bacterium]|nr:hypothetical protein [Clostridia bacterium]